MVSGPSSGRRAGLVGRAPRVPGHPHRAREAASQSAGGLVIGEAARLLDWTGRGWLGNGWPSEGRVEARSPGPNGASPSGEVDVRRLFAGSLLQTWVWVRSLGVCTGTHRRPSSGAGDRLVPSPDRRSGRGRSGVQRASTADSLTPTPRLAPDPDNGNSLVFPTPGAPPGPQPRLPAPGSLVTPAPPCRRRRFRPGDPRRPGRKDPSAPRITRTDPRPHPLVGAATRSLSRWSGCHSRRPPGVGGEAAAPVEGLET